MDKDLIEKYKNDMIRLYAGVSKKTSDVKPAMAEIEENIVKENNEAKEKIVEENIENNTGNLLAFVTTLRNTYPVPNAKVTVFTGPYEAMNIIDTAFTDESGRTKDFVLFAPDKQLSLEEGQTSKPYSEYNLMIESDGYVDNIHLRIPVFRGITSIQKADLISIASAGDNTEPRVYDESRNYDL